MKKTLLIILMINFFCLKLLANNCILYPNPCINQKINISFEKTQNKIEAYIYDVSGKLIENKRIFYSKILTINFNQKLASGIYLAIIYDENDNKIFKKFIVK